MRADHQTFVAASLSSPKFTDFSSTSSGPSLELTLAVGNGLPGRTKSHLMGLAGIAEEKPLHDPVVSIGAEEAADAAHTARASQFARLTLAVPSARAQLTSVGV